MGLCFSSGIAPAADYEGGRPDFRHHRAGRERDEDEEELEDAPPGSDRSAVAAEMGAEEDRPPFNGRVKNYPGLVQDFRTRLPLITNVIPRKCKITSVIGAPIKVPQVHGDPTDAQVQELLDTYIAALDKLFEDHKKTVLGEDFEGHLKIM